MFPPNKDTFVLRDANGNVRVKIGNLVGASDMNYMYHFTRDGEYVDGVSVTGRAATLLLQQLAATYEGCQTWVLLAGPSWYTIPAAGLNFARWEAENAASVPECVRTAELMRGV